MTKPEALCHFLSPEEINWSIITCAPLAKSPNWASQIVRVFGSTKLYPYSNPKTASSDKKLSTISNFFWFFDMLFKGIYLELSIWSLKTECLWLKVPLPESCPTNRTGKPSSNNEPKANDSAVDQSIFKPSSTDFFLVCKILLIVLWILISDGTTFILFEIFLSIFSSAPVIPLLSFPFLGL